MSILYASWYAYNYIPLSKLGILLVYRAIHGNSTLFNLSNLSHECHNAGGGQPGSSSGHCFTYPPHDLVVGIRYLYSKLLLEDIFVLS